MSDNGREPLALNVALPLEAQLALAKAERAMYRSLVDPVLRASDWSWRTERPHEAIQRVIDGYLAHKQEAWCE